MKTRIFIMLLLAAVLIFSACNRLSAQNNNPVGAGQTESKDDIVNGSNDTDNLLDVVTSTADENESRVYHDFPEPPEVITDEIRADAAKTYLETDKTSYSADDVLRLSIVVAREDTFLAYGNYCDIQGWDEEKDEWVSALGGNGDFTDELCVSTGSCSQNINLSRYPLEDYPKYRIEKEVHVDTITVTAYSNEFTIE